MRLRKTFAVIGISSTLCFMAWRNTKMSQTEQRFNDQKPSSNSNVKDTVLRDVRFEPKSALDGLTKEHFRFSSETWEASDGVPVFLRRVYCGSPKNAERALREAAKTA